MRPCYAQNTSPESKGESVDDVIVCIFRKTKGSDESFLTLSQLRGVCRGAVEVCYRCEVMQGPASRNVYSFSKCNPPTLKRWKGICCLGLWAWTPLFIAMGVRGRAMETVGRCPSSLLSFRQHIWLQFIKSESKVSIKTSDLSLVQALFQGVLAFFCSLGDAKGFGAGSWQGEKGHSAKMLKRSNEGTYLQRCR